MLAIDSGKTCCSAITPNVFLPSRTEMDAAKRKEPEPDQAQQDAVAATATPKKQRKVQEAPLRGTETIERVCALLDGKTELDLEALPWKIVDAIGSVYTLQSEAKGHKVWQRVEQLFNAIRQLRVCLERYEASKDDEERAKALKEAEKIIENIDVYIRRPNPFEQ